MNSGRRRIMNNFLLDKEAILNAAEDVIRKYGPAKTNLTDIAKALKVSHAALYRHYDNKAQLFEEVAERWLNTISLPLASIVKETYPPELKLKSYLETLCRIKRQNAMDDPEMFENYSALTAASERVLSKHTEHLFEQLESIIKQGIHTKVLIDQNPRQLAIAIFTATTRFHYPAFVSEWSDTQIDVKVNSVIEICIRGIEQKNQPTSTPGC
jgi:AcrR family transcriptional regulator